jgi:BRCT domain type II-containing protein
VESSFSASASQGDSKISKHATESDAHNVYYLPITDFKIPPRTSRHRQCPSVNTVTSIQSYQKSSKQRTPPPASIISPKSTTNPAKSHSTSTCTAASAKSNKPPISTAGYKYDWDVQNFQLQENAIKSYSPISNPH